MEWEKFRRYSRQENRKVLAPDLIREVSNTSFFAPVLVEAFQDYSDPQTVFGHVSDDRIPRFFVIGKVCEFNHGYTILEGSVTNRVSLRMASWKPWERASEEEIIESLGRGLFGMQNRVTVSAHNKRDAGLETFPDRKRLVISDLRIEFYPERWLLAPINISDPFDWWLLSRFVPEFLEKYVEQRRRVPAEELTQWE